MTRLEFKIGENENRRDLIFKNFPDLIEIVNKDFKIEYVNEKAHFELLGYSRDDLIGKKLNKLIITENLIYFSKLL